MTIAPPTPPKSEEDLNQELIGTILFWILVLIVPLIVPLILSPNLTETLESVHPLIQYIPFVLTILIAILIAIFLPRYFQRGDEKANLVTPFLIIVFVAWIIGQVVSITLSIFVDKEVANLAGIVVFLSSVFFFMRRW